MCAVASANHASSLPLAMFACCVRRVQKACDTFRRSITRIRHYVLISFSLHPNKEKLAFNSGNGVLESSTLCAIYLLCWFLCAQCAVAKASQSQFKKKNGRAIDNRIINQKHSPACTGHPSGINSGQTILYHFLLHQQKSLLCSLL